MRGMIGSNNRISCGHVTLQHSITSSEKDPDPGQSKTHGEFTKEGTKGNSQVVSESVNRTTRWTDD